jgi:four helix bundle protein
MSYKNLLIWAKASELTIKIHKMTLSLPRFEIREEGSQIGRSIKSVRSNIVEGYGRRIYKQEFIRFIIFAIASKDETADHLDTLFDTNSLNDEIVYQDIKSGIEELGKMLHHFLLALQKSR